MAQVPPHFIPCQVCESIYLRDRSHIIREAKRVMVLKDDEDQPVGISLCIEHRDYLKRVIAGREETEHVRH